MMLAVFVALSLVLACTCRCGRSSSRCAWSTSCPSFCSAA